MLQVQSSAATEEFASCAAVAAWALSNVARGATPASAFIEMGIAHGLCAYLQSATSWPTLRNEILWCLVFLLAKEEEAVDAVVRNDGIISVLMCDTSVLSYLLESSACDSDKQFV